MQGLISEQSELIPNKPQCLKGIRRDLKKIVPIQYSQLIHQKMLPQTVSQTWGEANKSRQCGSEWKEESSLRSSKSPRFQNGNFRPGSSLLQVPHVLSVVKSQWTKMLQARKKKGQFTDTFFFLPLQGRFKVRLVSGILSFKRRVAAECPRRCADCLWDIKTCFDPCGTTTLRCWTGPFNKSVCWILT